MNEARSVHISMVHEANSIGETPHTGGTSIGLDPQQQTKGCATWGTYSVEHEDTLFFANILLAMKTHTMCPEFSRHQGEETNHDHSEDEEESLAEAANEKVIPKMKSKGY